MDVSGHYGDWSFGRILGKQMEDCGKRGSDGDTAFTAENHNDADRGTLSSQAQHFLEMDFKG